ncbi:hypothetical protein PP410_gp27 [Vibrio phage NF]|uniref:Uncharacterized protein n=1 Tax=Vibrio phage NF TaxID=2686202 RepID=A0A6B9J542_9CAUD|nr:hypothetical protein PP410_gp27 [Vibrio phage NF]QGZ13244.1 hypothetical protein [Vibrio phage NF]
MAGSQSITAQAMIVVKPSTKLKLTTLITIGCARELSQRNYQAHAKSEVITV